MRIKDKTVDGMCIYSPRNGLVHDAQFVVGCPAFTCGNVVTIYPNKRYPCTWYTIISGCKNIYQVGVGALNE